MRRNYYVLNIDKKRRYFSCENFEHIAYYYKNQENIGNGKRISYRNSRSNINMKNLKEKRN